MVLDIFLSRVTHLHARSTGKLLDPIASNESCRKDTVHSAICVIDILPAWIRFTVRIHEKHASGLLELHSSLNRNPGRAYREEEGSDKISQHCDGGFCRFVDMIVLDMSRCSLLLSFFLCNVSKNNSARRSVDSVSERYRSFAGTAGLLFLLQFLID